MGLLNRLKKKKVGEVLSDRLKKVEKKPDETWEDFEKRLSLERERWLDERIAKQIDTKLDEMNVDDLERMMKRGYKIQVFGKEGKEPEVKITSSEEEPSAFEKQFKTSDLDIFDLRQKIEEKLKQKKGL